MDPGYRIKSGTGPAGMTMRELIRGSLGDHLLSVNPIIAKNLAVGAAFSRDSRLQGAPTRPDQKLTSGEFQKQHEIVIASSKSCGEMDCRVVINATVGETLTSD